MLAMYKSWITKLKHNCSHFDIVSLVVGVSSASQAKCDDEKAAWNLHVRILSDEDLLLTNHLRNQEMIDLHVTQASNGANIIHPGLLVVSKERKVRDEQLLPRLTCWSGYLPLGGHCSEYGTCRICGSPTIQCCVGQVSPSLEWRGV